MFCIEGSGAISHMSVRNHPHVFNEPCMYAAIHIKGLDNGTKVLDGQSPEWKRFGLYRWHIMDPIRFDKDLKITIQDLGWRHDGRYLPQKSDISSVTYWYQTEPHNKFPKLPNWEGLEVN
jgi:hypothetical protein